MHNLLYKNELYMKFHFHANQSDFHKNGFALRLALRQRHKGTRKWPIPQNFPVHSEAHVHVKLQAEVNYSCYRDLPINIIIASK